MSLLYIFGLFDCIYLVFGILLNELMLGILEKDGNIFSRGTFVFDCFIFFDLIDILFKGIILIFKLNYFL